MWNIYSVYHYYIKETNEVFYVGIKEGEDTTIDYSTYLEIKNIQEKYSTDIRIIYKNLTKEEALRKEYDEISRIVTETDNVLVNRHISYKIRKSNFYSKDINLKYQKEIAPVIYATEIDKRYYGLNHKPFDKVEEKYLSKVAIKDVNINKEELKIVYNRNFDKYYKEVVELLEKNSSKILKSRYPNAITAWIYLGDQYIRNFNNEQERVIRKIGREVPVYHLIDVWKFLKNKFKNDNNEIEVVEINPINARRPLNKIKHRKTPRGVGSKCWYLGEMDRKSGLLWSAIEYFDEARENGYYYPGLYKSYAMTFRKMGDLDNEIDILNEAIEIFSKAKTSYSSELVMFYSQREKAIKKLMKKREKVKKILKKLQEK